MSASYRNILLLVVVAALGVACVPTSEGQESRATKTPFVPLAQVSKAELEGTKWLLDSYGPEEQRREPLAGSEVYVAFNNYEDMSGFAGCNNFGTTYDIQGDALISGELHRTRFDCPTEELRAQDEEILNSLASVETIGLEGDGLMLGNENAVLRFTKEPPPPITPLSGSFWQFDGFMIGEAFRPALYGSVITAEMAEGAIRGSSGCNAYGAEYEVDGELISVGEIAQTAMLCLDDEVMEQEKAFVSALGAADSFSHDALLLSIVYNGGELLFSRPATDTSPFTETRWHLVDLSLGPESLDLPDRAGITAEFAALEVVGSTGCNQYRSPYTAAGTTVTFGYVQATEEGCPDDASATLERRFMSALEQQSFAVRITEGELTLANVEGSMVFSSSEPAPSGTAGVPAVDDAVAAILSNDPAARRELVRFTTAGCTTVMGLGGPPKCEEGQVEGTPVEYFPVLGPGEGATIPPEAIDDMLDFELRSLYAAFRRSDDPEADPFYPPGAFGLIFEAGRGESVPCLVVRLDADGRIVRFDYLMFSALDVIEREAVEVLLPAEGEGCNIAAIGPPAN